jgi:hypothetical protein
MYRSLPNNFHLRLILLFKYLLVISLLTILRQKDLILMTSYGLLRKKYMGLIFQFITLTLLPDMVGGQIS